MARAKIVIEHDEEVSRETWDALLTYKIEELELEFLAPKREEW